MTMLRMLAFKPSVQATQITPMTGPSPSSISTIQPASSVTVTTVGKVLAQPLHAVTSNSEALDWRQLLPTLGLSGMSYALASNCTLVKYTDNKMELALSTQHEPMLNTKLKARIEEALRQALKRSVVLEIKVTDADLFTPVKQQRQEEEKRLQQATEAILQEPQVKQLIELCDATVDVSLLN